MRASSSPPLRLAIVGAGPVGLALAVAASQAFPDLHLHLFDGRPLDKDLSGDPRTLALSLGSVQWLRQLQGLDEKRLQIISQVHVSQQSPSLSALPPWLPRPPWGAAGFQDPTVCIRADEQGVPMLGAVLSYGAIAAPLQARWHAQVAQAPDRRLSGFGQPVTGLTETPDGVRLQWGDTSLPPFDLVVIAEGGVFADQARKAISRPYGQHAWVGTVNLARPHLGTAWERFTEQGPMALLPLPDHQAALVWCVPQADDPVARLSDSARLTVLNQAFHDSVGPLTALSPLKCFPLGLNAERHTRQGRTVRIGNAAQTLHPVAGQGLNLGLRDAIGLIQTLQSLPGTPTAQDLAARWAHHPWQRQADRWSLLVATDALARGFTLDLPGASFVRGLGLAALSATPWAQGLLARLMMFGVR